MALKKRLLLVNPTHKDQENASRIKFYDMPPMALAYLAALTPDRDWDIQIVDENYEALDPRAAPDLVGITSLTYNSSRAYELARGFRARASKVVMGGIHPSVAPEEALRFADAVVIGEGENAWPEVLKDFEANRLQRVYHGTPANLKALPTPRCDLFRHPIRTHSVLTSRGCPLNCEFCSVTSFFGGRYHRRPAEHVLAELETIRSSFFMFSDDNFGGLSRKHLEETKQLLRGMIARGFKFRWGSQTGINYADDEELLKLTRQSGCLFLFVGIESVDERSLKGSVRKGNVVRNLNRVREAVKRFHDHGIPVLGAFVFGNDEDDRDIFKRTRDFIFESRMDMCNFCVATPYPGTRLFQRLQAEGRMRYHDFPGDWRHFNHLEATFRPRHMTPEELEEGVFNLYMETTNLWTSFKRAWKSLWTARSPLSGLAAFACNRNHHAAISAISARRRSGLKHPSRFVNGQVFAATPAVITPSPPVEEPVELNVRTGG